MEAFGPVRGMRKLVTDGRVVARRHVAQDVVVRRRDVIARRIVKLGQLRCGHEAAPLVAAVAGNRQQSRPASPRHQTRRNPADVPVDVGVNHVLRRHLPASHGRLEFPPISRAIQRKRREVGRRAWLLPHHTDDDRPATLPVDAQHGAVLTIREPHDARRLAPHANRVLYELQVGRACKLDNDVLLIHVDDGETEGDALVMPDRDAGARRLARPDDVPARRHEVRDIAHPRICDRAMRIVREDRLPTRRFPSAHDPVVRAFDPIERDVRVDLRHAPERVLIQTVEIETRYGIEIVVGIRVEQLVGALRAHERNEPRMEQLARTVADTAQ